MVCVLAVASGVFMVLALLGFGTLTLARIAVRTVIRAVRE